MRNVINQFHLNCCIFLYIGGTDEKLITGKIVHVGSNSIEENCKIEILLQDTSLMDVSSNILASTTISNATIFPIPYELKYNSSSITPSATYTVTVTISRSDGTLLYINDVLTPVHLSDPKSSEIDVAVVKSKTNQK